MNIYPRNVSAAYGLSHLTMLIGFDEGSERGLELALNYRPRVTGMLLGHELYRKGGLEEATKVWREARVLDGLLNQAHILREGGYTEEEINLLNATTDAFPEWIEPWLRLADAYKGSFRNTEAVRAYEQALDLDPGSVEANLGISHTLLRSPSNATLARYFVEQALFSLELQPLESEIVQIQLGQAYSSMGRIMTYQGRDLDAVLWLRKALELDYYPKGRICIELAEIYSRINKPGMVSESIDCAIEETAKLIEKGNIQQAILDYRQILIADPGNSIARSRLRMLDTPIDR